VSNYALKDAATAIRTPLVLDPLNDAQIAACRSVLIAHGADDLIDMLLDGAA
jgi:hypothetical protein